jgi:hypothetical protein
LVALCIPGQHHFPFALSPSEGALATSTPSASFLPLFGDLEPVRLVCRGARRLVGIESRHAHSLKHVSTEMALHVLAYNMKRVMRILGVGGLMDAIRA